MFDHLETAAEEMETALAELEPNSLIGTQPARALELLRRHERAVAAARLKLTARAEEMHPWQREGFGSFEDWLAAKEGTSHGQARKKARTARKLRDRQKTADALADGEISEDEADLITDAADKNPAAERDLLDTARNKGRSHDDLKKKAADAKAAGEDDRARADRLRRGRRAGWGVDREGFWTLSGRFEPHIGAEMKAHLAAEVDRIFAAARKAGTREGHDRYRADAIANLIRGHDTADPAPDSRPGASSTTPRPDGGTTGTRSPSAGDFPVDEGQLDSDLVHHLETAHSSNTTGGDQHGPRSPVGSLDESDLADEARPRGSQAGTQLHKELIIDVNLETLRRGLVLSGETCTIRGVGPIPVEIARRWADDAFIKAVIRDGTDIKTVVHYGRHIRAEVRTALGIRDRHTCQVPGCSNPRIEYDHDRQHAHHGPTDTTNLRALCVPHHRQRTHGGYELHGPPGDRRWTGPDGQVLFADHPDHLSVETDQVTVDERGP